MENYKDKMKFLKKYEDCKMGKEDPIVADMLSRDVISKCFNTLWDRQISGLQWEYITMWT